jgi:hypothetical protein
MHENISEVLGASAEHAETKKALRTVAVDEETTIEDFI